VTIQYQNTIDEFTEASEALATRKARKNPVRRSLSRVALIVFWLIFAGIISAICARNSPEAVFHIWFPVFFWLIVIFIVACFKLFRSKQSGTRLRSGAFLGLLGLAAILFLIEFLTDHANPSTAPTLRWAWLLPHVGWLFLAAWLLVATIKSQLKQRKSLWDGQATYHRAKTADISADGIVVTDLVSRQEYRWQAFVGWQETDSLIVIFISDFQLLFFPKKAFKSTEELDAMRALTNLISAAPSSAFPVVSANMPPPLPADQHT
jgi:hypothetical protein